MDVTIVIPVLNELAFTRQCLESLRRAGVPDDAVVVVDNGSSDGTAEFLASRPRLRVIRNETNRGCSVAWNQGVNASRSAWTLILNNDVVVPPGFFEGLLAFAEESRCDIISPAIGEGALDYDLDAFAGQFSARLKTAGRRGVAYGSAFMVHRRVFDAVGLFDTQVGLAGNEDEDFFRRAQNAGFTMTVTGRAFLHHFGSVTQRSVKNSLGLPNSARLSEAAYFRKKHHITWLRRQINRRREKIQGALWRWSERRRFGLTLRMRREAGRWSHA